ncbi:MAG: hypothetical protein BWY82_00924 [Verrucomicrobia bacterium ADurb.Bin474]|nr:MAG: hypothetical protein BWY82_00924 [Verrucomicrobia bacterium ADurb.Bin474]
MGRQNEEHHDDPEDEDDDCRVARCALLIGGTRPRYLILVREGFFDKLFDDIERLSGAVSGSGLPREWNRIEKVEPLQHIRAHCPFDVKQGIEGHEITGVVFHEHVEQILGSIAV